jgi:hypothetical protein
MRLARLATPNGGVPSATHPTGPDFRRVGSRSDPTNPLRETATPYQAPLRETAEETGENEGFAPASRPELN